MPTLAKKPVAKKAVSVKDMMAKSAAKAASKPAAEKAAPEPAAEKAAVAAEPMDIDDEEEEEDPVEAAGTAAPTQSFVDFSSDDDSAGNSLGAPQEPVLFAPPQSGAAQPAPQAQASAADDSSQAFGSAPPTRAAVPAAAGPKMVMKSVPRQFMENGYLSMPTRAPGGLSPVVVTEYVNELVPEEEASAGVTEATPRAAPKEEDAFPKRTAAPAAKKGKQQSLHSFFGKK